MSLIVSNKKLYPIIDKWNSYQFVSYKYIYKHYVKYITNIIIWHYEETSKILMDCFFGLIILSEMAVILCGLATSNKWYAYILYSL